jgi:beta-ureidopropionase / N-carbamoyl-L-amino-acid hydrolase
MTLLQPRESDIDAGIGFARPLFDAIGRASFDGVGFTRPAYGQGEQLAHDLVAGAARSLDLRVDVDAALNLSITLEGTDESRKPLVIGSHLDAVPGAGISTALQVY